MCTATGLGIEAIARIESAPETKLIVYCTRVGSAL
jgi:hypothetical protein